METLATIIVKLIIGTTILYAIAVVFALVLAFIQKLFEK